jgi:hypothetical protein
MPRPPVLVLALVLACLVLAPIATKRLSGSAAADGTLRTDDGDTVHVTPEIRARGLSFAPEVSAQDRAWVLAAIAHARPEAKRLIGEVDGMVTIETDPAQGQPVAMGITRPLSTGFRVWLNAGRLDGTRKVDRDQTVLHELGHVIDFSLIPQALDERLDAGIPDTGSCEQEGGGIVYGDCAPAEERLADTFAKWALGGSVSAVGAGYGITNPPSLDTWGEPLVALSLRLAR